MKSFLLNQFTSKWWSRSYPGSSWRCRQQFLEKKMICKVFSSISLLLSPSAPMETNLTPLLAMKSRALLTLAILWNLKSCRINISWIKLTLLNPHGDNWNFWPHLILPLSGLGRVSPEMTSSNSINLRPFLKSSSMFSIWVPAFLKWELTQAVKV